MTDVFQKTPRELSAEEIAKIELIKDQASVLMEALAIGKLTDESRRQMALAQARLEESVMWAVKALTA